MEEGKSFKEFCATAFCSASKELIIEVTSDLLDAARRRMKDSNEVIRGQEQRIERLTFELEKKYAPGKMDGGEIGTGSPHVHDSRDELRGRTKDAEWKLSQEKDNHRTIGSKPVANLLRTTDDEYSRIIAPHHSVSSFQEVYNESTAHPFISTVFCWGLGEFASFEDLDNIFHRIGPIVRMNVVKDKGLGFVRFLTKEDATNAILWTRNEGMTYKGTRIHCTWAKRNAVERRNMKSRE